MTPPTANLPVIMPIAVAAAWACLVLVVEMFTRSTRFTGVAWLTMIGFGVVAWLTHTTEVGAVTFAGALVLDDLASYFNYLFCMLGVLAVLLSIDYLPLAGIRTGEFYPILMFAVVGLLVMAAASDLIVMFLGLETMSIAVYVLAGSRKSELRSNEAAVKYLLLGAFASALLLYGMALVYAVAGSTILGEVNTAIAAGGYGAADRTVLMLGIGLVLVGFAFKIAAVPFHLWAPDVYEGAPTSVTAFMATAVKAGGFAALLRVAIGALAPVLPDFSTVLWVTAAATMTVGNFVALRQTSIKRMLAYSSIAHTGYLLVGLTAGTPAAGSAMLFYLTAYGLMNVGAFAVLIAMANQGDRADEIADLAGLGQARPLLALAMTVCMLSLIGIPPLGGFMGKLYLFSVALEEGLVGLVVVAVLNSVVSAAYYLGVVRAMYFDAGEPAAADSRPYAVLALVAATAGTVWLGIAPGPFFDAASRAFEVVVLGP